MGFRGLWISCWLLSACRFGFEAIDSPNPNCRFRDVAAGGRDVCVVNSQGELWCWGYLAGAIPRRIDVGGPVRRVAVGHDAVYALRDDAKVRAFGSGGNGELGTGLGRDEVNPVPLFGDPDVSMIGGGRSFACMVTVAGKLACWGREYDGELGDGSPGDSEHLEPTELPDFGAPITDLDTGGFSACATLADQPVHCWGAVANTSTASGANAPTRWGVGVGGSLALGIRFHCELRDGAVTCRGRGDDGQLGDGIASTTLREATVLTDAIELDSGSRSTCAIKADGTLWCWGGNRSGELGVGDVGVRLTPTQVGLEGVVRVSIGFATACAEAAGQVFCWGNNNSDQLGRNTGGFVRAPTAISELPAIPFVDVDVGGTFGCGRTSSGEVWCWGQNRRGQLGSGSGDAPSAARMVPLPFSATAIVLGDEHACALGAGTMRCWGNNESGQLGTSVKTSFEPPIRPAVPNGAVIAMMAKDDGTCAVVAGQLYCWGDTMSPVPTLVAGLPADITQIAGGRINRGLHRCAVSSTGTDCWGANFAGQLGNGTTVESATPVRVLGNHQFEDIAVSYGGTCGIEAGTLYCWGELVSGTTVTTPTPVSLVSPAVSLHAAGAGTLCVRLADGSRSCFGDDDVAQYLDGASGTARSIKDGTVAHAATYRAACGVRGDGVIRCSGDPRHGVLGTRPATATPMPVPVACE